MFKITFFLISVIISTSLISQSLQSRKPNSGSTVNNISHTLSGHNILGFNNIDDTLMKPSSFNVNSFTQLNSNTYPNFSKPGKNIDVLIETASYPLNSIMFYQKENELIHIDMNNVYGPGLYGKANILTTTSLGSYNLVLINSNNNNTQIIENALTLVASNEPSIDSAVVETQNYRILDIYGDQTHFTSNNLSVTIDSSQHYNSMDSFVVINDEHLRVYGEYIMYGVKSSFSILQSWVKIHNSIDDTLTYPFKKYMTSSIGDNINTFTNIQYFPNPTSDIVRIQSEEFSRNTIFAEVYSPNGQLIISRKFAKNEPIAIDLKAFASGLYNIRISSHNKAKILRVIRR